MSSSPNSKRGLGDLDALMPSSPTVQERPVDDKKTEELPRSRKALADPASQPVPTRPRRLKTRSQVFYLPDDQIAALDRMSRQTDRSKSDLVREAVTHYLGL